MRVTLLRSAQNPEVSPAAAPTWPPKPARDIAPQVTGLLPRLVRTSTAHAAPRSGQREKAAESPAPARARPRVARRTSPPGRPPPAAPRPIAGLSSGPGIGLVAPAPPSGTPQAPSLDVRAPVACVSPGDRLRCMHAASPPREDRGSTNSCTRYTADCGPSSGVASLDRHAEGVLRILLALRATPTPSPQRPGGSRGRRQVDLDHAAAEDGARTKRPGKVARGALAGADRLASMEPGPKSPGKKPQADLRERRELASMEPGPKGPGKTSGSTVPFQSLGLQWSPDQKARESRLGSAQELRIIRFNGARTKRPGKELRRPLNYR